MTYDSNRLDSIEADLELAKEILLATAKRAAAADERITTNEKLAQLSRKTDKRLNRLSENVETAFQTISLMVKNNRAAMAELGQKLAKFGNI